MAYNHLKALELRKKFEAAHSQALTPDVVRAIDFAIEAHRGQVRKSEAIPYVSHLFDVAEILIENQQSENLIIAGLLHDIMEDTAKTKDDILALFSKDKGCEIIKIILADTETEKGATWQQRKQATIDFAAGSRHAEGLLLICADKIANLNSLNKSMQIYHNEIWNFFNQGKEKQIWYFESLYRIFTEKLSSYPQMLNRYKELLDNVR